MDREHQILHQCCPYRHGQTIPYTPFPFLVKLFKAPISQQNPSVANTAKWERICTVENVTNVGDMLEERVLGQHCGALWQEKRTAMATALQPESRSDNKLQQITLEVRATTQKLFSWTRSPFPQTNVAAVLTLCQWAQQKISPHTAHSPLYSPGVLSAHPTPTHTLSQSLSPLCFRKQVDKPHLSIS